MQIGSLVRTLFSRFLVLLLMIVYAIPLAIFLCIPKNRLYDSKIFFWFCDVFYRSLLYFSFLPIRYKGLENLPTQASIIVANHQSSLDVPIVGALMHQYPHIWLAKHELMESPILRFVLPRVAVLIDMSTPQKGLRSLIKTISLIQDKNRHLIVFPEGGRYTDGKIHDFFSGFVILAKKTGRPVIPICIFGLNKAYPPETFLVNYIPITVIIGPPFIVREDETDEAFKERVYQWFVTQKED